MDSFNPKPKKGPEAKLQAKWIDYFKINDWYTLVTHGSTFQAGFPDLFICHTMYGQRWVEIKVPWRRGDVFTAAQHITFPKLCANGSGVWVLTGDEDEDLNKNKIAIPSLSEYQKLWKQPNWWTYLQGLQ